MSSSTTNGATDSSESTEGLANALSLQEVLGAIDESISMATTITNNRAANSRRGEAERDRHRDETLRALQEQHAAITSTFLGNNDIDPEEIERVNSVLAERMRKFYDMCERDNNTQLREVDVAEEEQHRRRGYRAEGNTHNTDALEEEKEDFTYRPQSIHAEPTMAPPSPPRQKIVEAVHAVDSDESEDDDSMMSFQCPITQVRMTDPVTCMDGHTYERAGIEKWLTNHNTSPLTGVELPSKFLIPNHSLRNAIEEYRDNRRSKK